MSQSLLKLVANFETTINAKLAAGGTSLALTSNLDSDGNALPSGTYGFTLSEGESNEEHIVGIVSGSNVTSLVRNITRNDGITAQTGKIHRKSASIKITNYPAIHRINNILDGTTDLDKDTPLKYDGNPTITDDAHLATKKYTDDIVLAGGPDATAAVKGVIELATSAESQAGTDSGGTSASLVALPGDIAKNIQNSAHNYSASTDDYVAAFLTGGTGAQSTPGTWAAVSDGSFRITIDGTAYNIDAINFTGDVTMDDVAATIQAAIRTATSALETCVWDTDHFIISSVNAVSTSSSITVTSTSTGTVGTDISGAGGSNWMDSDTGNGTVTAAAIGEYTLAVTPAWTAYAEGQIIAFKASNANIGAMTIDIDGVGSETIKKNNDQDLEDDDIETDSIVVLRYDGTNFQMINQQASMPSTALLAEMAAFFAATDISGAEAETLTDNSDADGLHTHPTLATVTKSKAAQFGSGGDDFWVLRGDLEDATVFAQTDVISFTETTVQVPSGANVSGLVRTNENDLNPVKDFALQFVAKITSASNNSRMIWGIMGTTIPDASGNTTSDHAAFIIDASDNIYASVGDGATQNKSAAITGLTISNYNSYRIERVGSNILFYVNGTLEKTLSANLPDDTTMNLGFGRTADSGAGSTATIRKFLTYAEAI